jgi:Fe-S-cluster containining protein
MTTSAPPIVSLTDPESLRLGAQMTALAQAMAGTEQVMDFASTGWLPDRFFDLLAELYATYDSYIAHNISASALKIQCRFGCTRCCHQAVHGVYSFEVIHLYRQLRSLPEYGDIHNTFVARADEFQKLVAEFTAEPGHATASEPTAAAYAMRKFAAAAKPCPLLLGNNCRVYEHRPVPCRMYYSLTHPMYCTTPYGQNFHIEVPEETNAILWHLSSRLAFPFSEYLAQGLVSFAFRRQFQPWNAPGAPT